MTTRRSFLTACIATFAAPAIVRASSLMPVKVRRHWMEGMPLNEWHQISAYGVADGITDDRMVIQKYIDNTPVIYFPTGVYTMEQARMRIDTCLREAQAKQAESACNRSTSRYR